MSPQHQSANNGLSPFGDLIYVISSFLDPKYGLMWLDTDVLVDDDVKEQIRKHVKGKEAFITSISRLIALLLTLAN